MTKFTEGRHPGEFLLSEANFHRSRDTLRIAESQTIVPGQVLAARVVSAEATATTEAGAGNTGNATITLAVTPVSAAVKNGVYRGTATSATKVRWEDPDGVEIGISTHGAAFDGPVKFTIAAGSTANVAGDTFSVTVTVETGDIEHGAWNPTVEDVSAVRSVALYGVTTGVGETASIAGITRDAEVKAVALEFIAGVTADQRAAAIGALKLAGIIAR